MQTTITKAALKEQGLPLVHRLHHTWRRHLPVLNMESNKARTNALRASPRRNRTSPRAVFHRAVLRLRLIRKIRGRSGCMLLVSHPFTKGKIAQKLLCPFRRQKIAKSAMVDLRDQRALGLRIHQNLRYQRPVPSWPNRTAPFHHQQRCRRENSVMTSSVVRLQMGRMSVGKSMIRNRQDLLPARRALQLMREALRRALRQSRFRLPSSLKLKKSR